MMRPSSSGCRSAFTLVELLVSITILTLLLVVLVTITNQTSKTWRYTTSKVEQFREARTAFETMTRRVGQATLNTYLDYVYQGAVPISYTRQSDLRFICGNLENTSGGPALLSSVAFPNGASGMTPIHPTQGVFFQAPLGYVAPTSAADPTYAALRGMDNLLNTWGYYVEVNDDQGAGSRPSIFTSTTAPALRVRSRLMELMQSSNDQTSPSIYRWTLPAIQNSTPVPNTWFTDLMSTGPSSGYYHVLAENIIALVILPKLSKQDQAALQARDSALAPNYFYNSDTAGSGSTAILNTKNQLPPVLQVTMVAIDEPSAALAMPNATQAKTLFAKLQLSGSSSLFTTADNYASDLQLNPPPPVVANSSSLESLLIANKINYRIFTTNVSIRGAKWSSAAVK